MQEALRLSTRTDSDVAEQLDAALNELDAAYGRPSERSAAYDAAERQLRRSGLDPEAPFMRFVRSRMTARRNDSPDRG